MANHSNRRDLMVETAADLFIANGYRATSVRQIADAVGCTEAALYYHFPGGKRTLLQAVIETYAPDFLRGIAPCAAADSLPALLACFSDNLQANPQNQQRLRWIIAEFANLSAAEQALVRQKIVAFHAEMTEMLRPFTPDSDPAHLAWLLIAATQGHLVLFNYLGLDTAVDHTLATQNQLIAQLLIR